MAQHLDILLPDVRYTRVDYTALRAYLNRLPLGQIASRYYSDEEREALGGDGSEGLRRHLDGLRDRLIQRATDDNPHLAELLRKARRSGIWSGRLADFLVRADAAGRDRPRRDDPVSAWFKPVIAAILRAEGVRRIDALLALIETRGAGWWKPVPRIGAGKAARIEEWLRRHFGLAGTEPAEARPASSADLVVLRPGQAEFAPIERILLAEAVDGRSGRNRNTAFCLISARHDRDAIEAYLHKFRGQEKTRRAYQKEIERFLLWCVIVRGVALSSALHEDCEAYKDFLAALPAGWVAPKRPRHRPGWRPFAGPLSPASQRYAVQVLRFFFNWLVHVRYLAGNPWLTVADPRVATPLLPLQIDRALPESLWDRLTAPDGVLDTLCAGDDAVFRRRYRLRGAHAGRSMAAQFRLARAALLLLGETGIRREEAADASRDRLRPLPGNAALWELDVLGKRHKWRTVFPSRRTIDALRAHWQDRGLDFDGAPAALPLLSPLAVPQTGDALRKHRGPDGTPQAGGFSADGLYQAVKRVLRRIADDETVPLDTEERAHLRRAAPHAFRHTFGRRAVAGEVPLDVVQRVLGHASLQTTTLYVQAEKLRSIEELGKFFRR